MKILESSTDIHIGIIRRDKISFDLSGSFEISGSRKQCKASCEARVEKGKIIVHTGQDRLVFTGWYLLRKSALYPVIFQVIILRSGM